VGLLVFLEGVVPDEVVANTALPALGVDGEVIEGVLHLDPLVDLFQGEAVGRGGQDLVNQHAVVLGRLLQLLLGVVLPVQLQGRRLGLLPPPFFDGLLDVRELALLAVFELPGLVFALLGSVRRIFRKRMLARPADLPLDRGFAGRGLRHVLLGEFHCRLLPEPLLSLRHDAVLWRATWAALLGYYGLQARKQLERHFWFDGGWRLIVPLDCFHDFLLRCRFRLRLGHVLGRFRELTVAVVLGSHGGNFFGARATSFRIV
jgi:hypothetical protein